MRPCIHGTCVAVVGLGILAAWGTSGAGTSLRPAAGSVVGVVTLKSRVRGTPLPSALYPTRRVDPAGAPTTPEINNVIVYVKDAPFPGDLPVMQTELRQRNEMFVPHVLAVTKGSWVEFPNDDLFFHNVFSLSGAATFNLGRYPQGQSRKRQFLKPGLVKVYCQIHSHMSASILVLDHPYFTIPNVDGRFELRDVPAGDHVIVGWHERIGEYTAPLHIDAGKAATITLSLPLQDRS
jgi:plastocyanin